VRPDGLVWLPVGSSQRFERIGEEYVVTKTESLIFMVVLVLIVAWAMLGPGGWLSGVIGALVGIAVGAGSVLARRRRGT